MIDRLLSVVPMLDTHSAPGKPLASASDFHRLLMTSASDSDPPIFPDNREGQSELMRAELPTIIAEQGGEEASPEIELPYGYQPHSYIKYPVEYDRLFPMVKTDAYGPVQRTGADAATAISIAPLDPDTLLSTDVGVAKFESASEVIVSKRMASVVEYSLGSTSTSAPVVAARRAVADSSLHEWVLLPWQLQANTALSYRGGGESLPATTSTLPYHPEPAQIRAPTESSGAKTASGYFDPTILDIYHPSVNLLHQNRTADMRSIVGRSDAVPSDEADFLGRVSHELIWSQRMLRWRDDDVGTTAWVRDYRFDAENGEPLVESLRHLAHQQGITLYRIMLNGHELWQSTP